MERTIHFHFDNSTKTKRDQRKMEKADMNNEWQVRMSISEKRVENENEVAKKNAVESNEKYIYIHTNQNW